MEKKDLKKQFKSFYSERKGNISLVDVPGFQYISIDGKGNPNTSQDYKQAMEALFSLAYHIKFRVKREQQIDYGVMPLEGLWWMDNMEDFSVERKEEWKWSAMIMQPEYVDDNCFAGSVKDLSAKKILPALEHIRLITYSDGLAAQILHIGPYAEEKPTIDRLHGFIADNGYILSGKHREIYLSDMRRCAPEKLRTIIRQPVSKP